MDYKESHSFADNSLCVPVTVGVAVVDQGLPLISFEGFSNFQHASKKLSRTCSRGCLGVSIGRDKV